MSLNWWGVIASFAFVFAILGIAGALLKLKVITAGVSRKLVHIGVAHWWFLAMYFFDSWQYAIIGPICFVLINIASYVFRLLPAMEPEERTKNLGTIYFPVSLVVLVLFSWAGKMPIWVAGMGIIVLGYGDGLAAIFGENVAKRSFRIFTNTKSILGTVVMFVASAAVVVFFVLLYGGPSWTAGALVAAALLTAAVATVVELFTPLGLDNLTVPIITSLVFGALFT